MNVKSIVLLDGSEDPVIRNNLRGEVIPGWHVRDVSVSSYNASGGFLSPGVIKFSVVVEYHKRPGGAADDFYDFDGFITEQEARDVAEHIANVLNKYGALDGDVLSENNHE